MTGIAHIGLGSNLDDRLGHLDRAVERLSQAEGCGRVVVSRYYETMPVGGPSGQSPYLNAAAEVETDLPATALLDLLQSIEHQEGRVRLTRWGERTLDLDILLFGEQVINSARLIVPHPRMMLRAFVLAPLASIAPDVIEPGSRKSIRELLANCETRPGAIDLAGWRRFSPRAFEEAVNLLSPQDWLIRDPLSTQKDNEPTPTFRVIWKQALDDLEPQIRTIEEWPPRVVVDTSIHEHAILEVLTAASAVRSDGIFIDREPLA